MNLVFIANGGAGTLTNADIIDDLDRLWRKLNHKRSQIQFAND